MSKVIRPDNIYSNTSRFEPASSQRRGEHSPLVVCGHVLHGVAQGESPGPQLGVGARVKAQRGRLGCRLYVASVERQRHQRPGEQQGYHPHPSALTKKINVVRFSIYFLKNQSIFMIFLSLYACTDISKSSYF